jgi:hypothetical protein
MEMFLFNPTTQFRSFVYRNLNDKCWSVKALEGPNKGRVVLHARYIAVTGRDGGFKVSETGRQRVLREKRKNVHAGVVGSIYWADVVTERYEVEASHRINCDEDYESNVVDPSHTAFRSVVYNPYNNSQFVWEEDGEVATIHQDRRDLDIVLDADMKVYVQSSKALSAHIMEHF